ncbi:MAG: anti-sigma factor antagonist [Sphaerochaetaceae bacterium]|nr:anti-sigma factor antagonist [Sphaerochaetaceae bacterium]
MGKVEVKYDGQSAVVAFSGKVDSGNSEALEKEMNEELKQKEFSDVVLDFQDLEYISSAGLRIILRLKKNFGDVRIINANSEIYEILDTTGFVEMFEVEKAYKTMNLDGCEVIGEGAKGIVYRTDPETIVKVYKNPDALSIIKNERDVARRALIMGLPTAISYDIVKVGERYASVFELIDAKSMSSVIIEDPSRIDECVDIFVDLLKQIHATEAPKGVLKDQKKIILDWYQDLKGNMDEEDRKKCMSMIEAIPETNHVIHGDYHTNNIMMHENEPTIIDMDTMATGNPVFEFSSIYLGFRGFSELNHDEVKRFLGLTWEQSNYFLEKVYEKYFGTTDKKEIRKLMNKAMIIGQLRVILRNLIIDPGNTAKLDYSRNLVKELLKETDSLAY